MPGDYGIPLNPTPEPAAPAPVPEVPNLPAETRATQTAWPTRTTIRTGFQTLLSVILTAGVVVPIVLAIARDTLGEFIPASAWPVLVLIGAFLVGLSAFVARVMAIPAVNAWLTRHGLGAKPPTPTS